MNLGQTDEIGFVLIDTIDTLPALKLLVGKERGVERYITQQSMLGAMHSLKSRT